MNPASRARKALLLAVATATTTITAAVAVPDAQSVRSVVIDGNKIVFDLDELGRAEARLRSAVDRADFVAILRSMDPDLATVAVWDMTQIREVVEEGSDAALPIPGPCYEPDDCEKGVGRDPEPPVDPPSSVPTTAPQPVPTPVCYARHDVRRLESGIFFKSTSYRFHQHVDYCVQGLLVQPFYTVYSYYSDIAIPWECQDPELNNDIGSTVIPTQFHAHSDGYCHWELGLEIGDKSFGANTGHARPNISDTYGLHGELTVREGSAS